MFFFSGCERNILRHKIFFLARAAVIVRPAVHFGNSSGPIAVNMFDWSSPFQRIGFPRILNRFVSAPNTVEEIENENQLSYRAQNGEHANHGIHIHKFIEQGESRVRIISSRNTRQAEEVHREENAIHGRNRHPEMQITQCFVHHAAIHSREPMINSGKHSKYGRSSHHNMEVRHHKISIVNVDIQGGISKNNSRQTTRDKSGNQSDSKKGFR